jgi:hypothetical protein
MLISSATECLWFCQREFVSLILHSSILNSHFILSLKLIRTLDLTHFPMGVLTISELRDLPQPLSVEYLSLSLSPHQEEEDRHINTSRDPEVRLIMNTFSCSYSSRHLVKIGN